MSQALEPDGPMARRWWIAVVTSTTRDLLGSPAFSLHLFDEVVVGGKMTMAMVGQMLEQHFGRGYYEGGTLDVKFTNITWPNDHVTAHGVITHREDGRAHLQVWMEKDDGTVVIVGGATAAV